MTAIEAEQARQQAVAKTEADPASPGDLPSLNAKPKTRKKGPDLARPW